jgi:hypothetical protein
MVEIFYRRLIKPIQLNRVFILNLFEIKMTSFHLKWGGLIYCQIQYKKIKKNKKIKKKSNKHLFSPKNNHLGFLKKKKYHFG